jgi:hypothetical protein
MPLSPCKTSAGSHQAAFTNALVGASSDLSSLFDCLKKHQHQDSLKTSKGIQKSHRLLIPEILLPPSTLKNVMPLVPSSLVLLGFEFTASMHIAEARQLVINNESAMHALSLLFREQDLSSIIENPTFPHLPQVHWSIQPLLLLQLLS